MSLQSLLYGTGPEAEADADADRRILETEHAAHMTLPVCAGDHVLDSERGEQWMSVNFPARVGDLVRRHVRTAVGRHPVVEMARTFAASEVTEEIVITEDHVLGGGWLPGEWDAGFAADRLVWRTGTEGQMWRVDRTVMYRWAIIRRPVASPCL